MKIRKVLIALDGSRRSERAAPWVRRVFPSAEVSFLRVVDLPDPLALNADLVSDELLAATEYLGKVADREAPGAARLVRKGRAAKEIAEAARETGADAVAVTTHGGAELQRRTFGRTTEKLLHECALLLLLVPAWEEAAPAAGRIGAIAVPVDGSEASGRAVSVAGEMAKEHGAEVVLIHGIEATFDVLRKMPGASQRGVKEQEIEEMIRSHRREIEGKLERRVEELRGHGIRGRAVCVQGTVPESIVKAAAEAGAEIFVMAGHGHGTIRRTFFGSTASRLVRGSSIPVLAVRFEDLKPGS